MSQRQSSWKLWVGIILILIVTGLIAVLWPAIAGAFEFSPSAPSVSAPTMSVSSIAITVPPVPIPGLPTFGLEPGEVVEVNGLVMMGALAAVIVGLVVVTGLVIGLINLLLSRFATSVETSDDYQQHVKVLEQKEKDRLKTAKSERPAGATQQHDYSRWAVWATGLVILMFVIFLTLMTVRTFMPDAQDVSGIIAVVAVLTAVVLAWRLRPNRLQSVDETDNQGIPWDAIVVIVTGMLVVGLGIGLVVLLNVPA